MFLCPNMRVFKEVDYSENDVFYLEIKASRLLRNRGLRSYSDIFSV